MALLVNGSKKDSTSLTFGPTMITRYFSAAHKMHFKSTSLRDGLFHAPDRSSLSNAPETQ